jgi:hypothetical protein
MIRDVQGPSRLIGLLVNTLEGVGFGAWDGLAAREESPIDSDLQSTEWARGPRARLLGDGWAEMLHGRDGCDGGSVHADSLPPS